MIHYITTNGIGNAWVAAELEIMSDRQVPFRLHSMRAPTQHFFGSEWGRDLNERTNLLYPMSAVTLVIAVLLAPFRFRGRFVRAMLNAIFGEREHGRARIASIAHLMVACVWAHQLRRSEQPVSLIHAQWVHSCGTIGMYAGWLLDVPFSFTGHAADLFRERAALKDKVRRAEFIVCISSFHRELYIDLGADPGRLHTVHCGIDLEKYPYRAPDLGDVPRVLSVGRLVEKKGFDIMIEAARILRERGVRCSFEIGGNGPLEDALRGLIGEDLRDMFTMSGEAILQEALPQFLREGDVFVQPCVWSSDNDVDGTPRTLMEAMATGMPSVSTRLAGIPDIIEHGESGLLVEPGDAAALADAVQAIVEDPDLASRLSEGGRRHIEDHFEIRACVEGLVEVFAAFTRPRTGAATPVPVTSVAGVES